MVERDITRLGSEGRGPVGRIDGRDVRRTNVAAGRGVAAVVESTLGPKGLDKMLVGADGHVVVTNDGAKVLENLPLDHPAARVLVETARRQDDRVNDGTTTAVVLAGELLSNAGDLVERGVPPAAVAAGYHRAATRASDALDEYAVDIDPDDAARLEDVARTVVTGKWDESAAECLARRAVETAAAVGEGRTLDFERITRQTAPGGSVFDSTVCGGLLVDLELSSTDVASREATLPARFPDATVVLVDGQLTVETLSGASEVVVETPEELREFEAYERERYDDIRARIEGVGADAVFCQKSIDDPVRDALARAGILAVERTRADEFRTLARVTGASPVAAVEELTPADAGRAELVERRSAGDREFVAVEGESASRHVSVLLRGGTPRVLDELAGIFDDCLGVLRTAVEEGGVLPGGGAAEVRLSRELSAFAPSVRGTEQLAVEAFSDALERVPWLLAESAGLDPIDVLAELHARHDDGEVFAGLDLAAGEPANTLSRGVVEPVPVKRRSVLGAAEAATTLVRVDDAVAVASPGEDDEPGHDHDHGRGGVVESTGGYPWTLGH
ncbi:thermosome subunit alpha [Halopelagius longus]|uniref:Chaperonin GroEL (HSP60 family) n=1 Tax=Halopelagius longus TaxID=1236180 RepID=A0A1H1FGF2_9EURY|nr:thermosome subunit alpha [Halopelagius longus]RDI70112.1 thermosome subunit 1 [Halopelagius longus]SDR00025.1 Chaperonin GroEL (HSP60 family) [Halopelagius longus]